MIKNRLIILASLLMGFSVILTGCTENTRSTDNAYASSRAEEKEAELPEGVTEEYDIVRVVDGDTYIIDINGTEERVRLIGVDTAESVHPDADKNTEAGKEASDYVKGLLRDKKVRLEYDVQERDKYGRVLAYVYVDGEMLNKTLLEEGWAKISTYPPNVKYVDDFKAIAEGYKDTESYKEEMETLASSEAGYVGNSSSKKCHKSQCSSVEKMSEHNKAYFETADEAKEQGYTACGICKPW